jgi:hypothetical protein
MVNHAGGEITGYTDYELLDLTFIEITPLDDHAKTQEALELG